MTNAEISDLVGRVPRQVKEYLDQLNLPSYGRPGRNRQTRVNEIGAEVIQLREIGWSYRKIGKHLKSSKKTVATIYQDYINWQSNGKRELPWDIRKYGVIVVKLKSEGLTWKQVCDEIGCSCSIALKLHHEMIGVKPKTMDQIILEKQTRAKIAQWLHQEEFSSKDIQLLLGISSASVRRYLK